MGTALITFLAEPLAKLHHPFLVARWAELTALTRKGQKIHMVTIPALDPGKTVVQITAMKIPTDDLFQIWAKKAVRQFRPTLINLLKGFKMILNAPASCRILRMARTVKKLGKDPAWTDIPPKALKRSHLAL